jgi:hypothetical protein
MSKARRWSRFFVAGSRRSSAGINPDDCTCGQTRLAEMMREDFQAQALEPFAFGGVK